MEKTRPPMVPDSRWTPDVDAMTERRLLGLVGLGVRARNAVVGVARVRDAAKRGTLKLAIIAPDASRHSLDKVVPLLAARHVRVIHGPSSATLGGVVGREATAVVGITNAALARGVRTLMELATPGRDQPVPTKEARRIV